MTAVAGIARDRVAGTGQGTSYLYATGIEKQDSLLSVRNGCRAIDIRADRIALNSDLSRSWTMDLDPHEGIARNHVAGTRIRAADQNIVSTMMCAP